MSIEDLVKRKYQLENQIKLLTSMLDDKRYWVLTVGNTQHNDVRSFTEEAVQAHLDKLSTELDQTVSLLQKAYRYLENQGDL
jgi:hypothetical protein